jgi:hypothetical protein
MPKTKDKKYLADISLQFFEDCDVRELGRSLLHLSNLSKYEDYDWLELVWDEKIHKFKLFGEKNSVENE